MFVCERETEKGREEKTVLSLIKWGLTVDMQALIKPWYTSHPEYLARRVFALLVAPAVRRFQAGNYMMWELQVLESAHFTTGQIQIYCISRTSPKTHGMARLAFSFLFLSLFNAHCQYTIIHGRGVSISLYSRHKESMTEVTQFIWQLDLFIKIFKLHQLNCLDTFVCRSMPKMLNNVTLCNIAFTVLINKKIIIKELQTEFISNSLYCILYEGI